MFTDKVIILKIPPKSKVGIAQKRKKRKAEAFLFM